MTLDGLLPATSQRSSLETATAMYEGNVEALASYLASRGVSREAAIDRRLGLVSEPAKGHDRFVGMMSIPYLSPGGVLAMKFRRIDDSEGPKFDSPSGQHARMYNAGVLQDPRLDKVLVTEGEIAAIVATAQLGLPCIGTPGTTWLEHWGRCFADIEVIYVCDNDDKADGSNPGLKFAKDKVLKALPQARLVTPPMGHDLDSWILAEGREKVLEGIDW